MTRGMYKEIDFCDIYLPPFFLSLLITGLVYVPLHWYWDHVVIQKWVWNRPVFELACFIVLLCLVTFLL